MSKQIWEATMADYWASLSRFLHQSGDQPVPVLAGAFAIVVSLLANQGSWAADESISIWFCESGANPRTGAAQGSVKLSI